MDILKFDISSKFASFTKPHYNSCISTYPHIHKCAILGIIGSIIGIEKKQPIKDWTVMPRYYEELKDIDVAIVPEHIEFPVYSTKITETTGLVSGETGGVLVTSMDLLCSPKWTIYLDLKDNKYKDKIIKYLINKECIFLPYLGRNSFPATIDNVELLSGENITKPNKIDSFYFEEDFKHYEDEDEESYSGQIFYTPVGYRKNLNLYEEKKVVLNNDNIEEVNTKNNLIKVKDKTLFMI